MLTKDPKADPLLPPCRSCLDHRSVKVFVSLVQILHRVLRLVFNVLYSRLLCDDRRFHILEQLGKLDHLPFNLLNSLMSALYCPQC